MYLAWRIWIVYAVRQLSNGRMLIMVGGKLYAYRVMQDLFGDL